MTLNENKFFELLRKSPYYLLNEAFSKVRNAKVIAIYPEEKSLILEDTIEKKFYYAEYDFSNGCIDLKDIQKFKFEEVDYKNKLKDSISEIFTENYNNAKKNLYNIVSNIILEKENVENNIHKKLEENEKKIYSLFVKKPKTAINNIQRLAEGIEKLKKDKFFGKMLVNTEKKDQIIVEKIDWNKPTGRIFLVENSKEISSKNNKYTLRGFKKAQVLAKEYWKSPSFRKNISSLIEDKIDSTRFCEFYKNITLLNEEELTEMLSKTLLSVSSSNKIDENLKKVFGVLKENKKIMFNWGLLMEAPPLPPAPTGMDAPAGAAPAAEAPEQAVDVSAEDVPPAEGVVAEGGEAMEEPAGTAELGSEEDLAKEATEEVKIINALLSVIEDVFWNGNQENTSLANIIKEIRDMRQSGNFDEERLTEIFRDLFSITQQIGTGTEEEVPAGEELPPEEGAAPEGAPGVEATTGTEGEPSPLENYGA
jgi:hypothetical protein